MRSVGKYLQCFYILCLCFSISTVRSNAQQSPLTSNTEQSTKTKSPSHPPANTYAFGVIAKTGDIIDGLTIKNFALRKGFYVVINNKGQAAYLAETNKGIAVFRDRKVIARVGEVQDKRQIISLASPSIDSEGHVAYIAQYANDGKIEEDPSIDHLIDTIVTQLKAQAGGREPQTQAEFNKALADLKRELAAALAKRKITTGIAVDKHVLYFLSDKLKTGEHGFEPYYDARDRLIVPISKTSFAAPDSALVDGKRDDNYASHLKGLNSQILRWFYNDKGQYLTGGPLTDGVGLSTGQTLAESHGMFAINQNGKILVVTRQISVMDYDALAKSPPGKVSVGAIPGSYPILSEDDDPNASSGYPSLYKTLGLSKSESFFVIGALNDAGNRQISESHLARYNRGYGGSINDQLQVAFPVRYWKTFNAMDVGGRDQPSEQAIVLGTPTSFKPTSNIVLTRATTTDAKSVTVDYTIGSASSSNELNQPIHFEIYRSPTEDANYAKEKIGEQDVSDAISLSPGKHSIRLISGTDLKPNTVVPYVVVVATYNGKKSTTYFRKYLLGAIAHGFNRYDYFLLTMSFRYVGSLFSEKFRIPDWEILMDEKLKSMDRYDDVIPFNWAETCGLDQSGMAVQAGVKLKQQILDWISIHTNHHPGDVVDIHLIGHSRGTVVVTKALNELLPLLRRNEDLSSYIELTLLDPHPANNSLETPWADFGLSVDTLREPAGLLLDFVKDNLYLNGLSSIFFGNPDVEKDARNFQAKAIDPALDIPQGVKKIDIWYQHTEAGCLTNAPDQEYIMNLWGLVDKAIHNNSGVKEEKQNLTTNCKATKVEPAVGHNQVPDVYEKQVVETGTLNRSTL